MGKIKIIFFINQLGGGGAEMHLLRLMNSLDHQKFQKELWVVRPGGGYEGLLNVDIKVRYLQKDHKASSTLSVLRSTRKLSNWLKSHKPDVLYSVLNLPSIVAIKAVHRAAYKSSHKVRTVISVQNTLDPKDKTGLVHRMTLHWIKRWFPLADRIVAISQGVKQDLIKYFNSKIPVQVIYNAGWDADTVAGMHSRTQAENLCPPEKFVMLCCGRLTTQKGYPYLLNALKDFSTLQDWELWILGTGNEQDNLELLCKKNELSSKVKFLGFQNNPFQYMAVADLFVLPSLWEGFGNVIVEAMRCGLPVLATDCHHGPAEIITHEKNGILVPARSSKSLAKEIWRLKSDQNLRSRLKYAGSKRAEDFHVDEIAAEYESVFKELYSFCPGKK